MNVPNRPQELQKARLRIARKVRELRLQRHWNQEELANQLLVSQGRLSNLERGNGSFTAEQLLQVLALFNVAASEFAPSVSSHESELQNALARLGALHLHEHDDVVPSEQLEEVAHVVREALLAESPRHITALAPVLVSNVDRINPRKLLLQAAEVGLERRLAWVVDNTVEALRLELPHLKRGPWAQQYRRAELVLRAFRDVLADQSSRSPEAGPPDLLDQDIKSKKTQTEVTASSSSISRRWGMVTSLQTQDFVDALGAARAAS